MRVKQHLVKRQASFAKFISKLEYTKSIFSHKNISLKHSSLGSCFEAFIKMSTTVALDFDLHTLFWNYGFFYLRSCACTQLFVLFLLLIYECMCSYHSSFFYFSPYPLRACGHSRLRANSLRYKTIYNTTGVN